MEILQAQESNLRSFTVVMAIHQFHIAHNTRAPCLLPNVCINIAFNFFLGITVVPTEIEDNGCVTFVFGRGAGAGEHCHTS